MTGRVWRSVPDMLAEAMQHEVDQSPEVRGLAELMAARPGRHEVIDDGTAQPDVRAGS